MQSKSMYFIDIHTHHFDACNPCILNCNPSEYEEKRQTYPDAMISSGIHPWYINETIEKELRLLESLIELKKIVAIGECGLDIYSKVAPDIQEKIFIQQIELAEKFHIPLIIHCVKMHNELIKIKKKLRPDQPWIIHGYRGNKILTEQLLRHDFYLSFGEKFNSESLSIISQDHIFLETDDSGIPIENIYENIGKVLNISRKELALQTEKNFSVIFEQKSL